MYYGMSNTNFQRLQRVQNAAVHELFAKLRDANITQSTFLMISIGYLCVAESKTVACSEVIYVSPTVNTVFIDKHGCSSVLMLRPPPPFGTVFPHLYALLTVSLVLDLSSRLRPTCSQDICSRSAVRASDALYRVLRAL